MSLPGAFEKAPRPGARPLVLGHRGASAQAPENTLAAFRLAMEQGADGVELDVQRCATGEVVVLHDEDTRRVAGEAVRVVDAPAAALRSLDVGAWKGDRFRGQRIPLLEEVLEELPGAVVNVELKGRDPRLAAAAAEVLRRAGAAPRALVSSFDPRLLSAFRRAAPEVARGLLVEDDRWWRLRAALGLRIARPGAIHPAASLVTAARARRWREAGLSVNVWTVDGPAEVKRLAALGAGAVITNVPGEVAAALGGARRPGGAVNEWGLER
jgi:glycerophosphoryl diester phosphodiesterase